MVLAFAGITCGAWAGTPVEAHLAFTVMQPVASGEREPFGLSRSSRPGPGKQIQLWIAAEDTCSVLIAGINRLGQTAWPDQPLLVRLKPHDNLQLPSAGGWKWETPGGVAEIDVLFLDSRSPELPHLAQLTEAMHQPVAPAVRNRQIAELRRMMDALTQRNAAGAEYSLKTDPVSLAGLLRGMGCDWCRDAQKISLPPGGSYLVRQRFP